MKKYVQLELTILVFDTDIVTASNEQLLDGNKFGWSTTDVIGGFEND
ncbi:MAG: hypothetical protein IJX98_04665 [Clostridia bacterium]|nr:hypothetical protein [Clostridia bacterium]